MKLTAYHKRAIVRAIMADVPTPDYNGAKEEMQLALAHAMSPLVRQVFVSAPQALRTEFLYASDYPIEYNQEFIVGDADYEKVLSPFAEQKAKIQQVKADLQAAIEGCTTVKRFIETFPEFAKYAQHLNSSPSKNLPALANVVAGVVALGWPKGKQP